MDKQKAIETLEGLRNYYQAYTDAINITVQLLNDQITVIDSEKVDLKTQLDVANATIADLQTKVPEATIDPVVP